MSNKQEKHEHETAELKVDLENKLARIGWKLRDQGCEHYGLRDHNDNHSGVMFRFGRLEIWTKSEQNFSASFDLRTCDVVVLTSNDKPNCVSIAPKNDRKRSESMIQFYNHD